MNVHKKILVVVIALLPNHKTLHAGLFRSAASQLQRNARLLSMQGVDRAPVAPVCRRQEAVMPFARYYSAASLDRYTEPSEKERTGYERQPFFNQRRALALGSLGAALAAYAATNQDEDEHASRFTVQAYAAEPEPAMPEEIAAFNRNFSLQSLPDYLKNPEEGFLSRAARLANKDYGQLTYLANKYPQHRQQIADALTSQIMPYIVHLAAHPNNTQFLLTIFAQYPEARDAIINALTDQANFLSILTYEYPNQKDNGAIYYGDGAETLQHIFSLYPESRSRITTAVDNNFEVLINKTTIPKSIRAFLDTVINQSPSIAFNNISVILKHNNNLNEVRSKYSPQNPDLIYEYEPGSYYYPIIENLAEQRPELRNYIVEQLFNLALQPNNLKKNNGAKAWSYTITTLLKKYPELSDSIIDYTLHLFQKKPTSMNDSHYLEAAPSMLTMLGKTIMDDYPERRKEFWETISNNILWAKTAVRGIFSNPLETTSSYYADSSRGDLSYQRFSIKQILPKETNAFVKLRDHQPLDPWATFNVVIESIVDAPDTAKELFEANHVDRHYFIGLLINPSHYHVIPEFLTTQEEVAQFLPDILKAIDEATVLPELYKEYKNNKYTYGLISERRDAAAAVINQWLAMPEFKHIVQNELTKAKKANPAFDQSFKDAKKIMARYNRPRYNKR